MCCEDFFEACAEAFIGYTLSLIAEGAVLPKYAAQEWKDYFGFLLTLYISELSEATGTDPGTIERYIVELAEKMLKYTG